MKFNDEQKEVLALLPQNVKESNELTDAAKLVLANLILWNGTDYAINEGYMYRTNKDMMKDTGIKSEMTIIAAVNKLVQLGLIERKTGQRKSASEYRLNTTKIENYTIKIDYKNENYSNKIDYKNENYSNKLQYNNDEIVLKINELQNTVNKLQDKITVLENELLQYKNYSNKNYSENKNYSTDIDIDKEIETDSKLNDINGTINNGDHKQDESEIETLENMYFNSDMTTDITSSNGDKVQSDINDTLEYSILGGDILSDDTSESDTDNEVKFIGGKFQVVSKSETEDEISSDVEQGNEDKINSDMTSSNGDFSIWGKLQTVSDFQTNRIEGYNFTEYDNLNDCKDISNGYHQVKRYIDIDASQLKASVSSTCSFGILSFKDNVYSFIACNHDITSETEDAISERSVTLEKKCSAADGDETASNNAHTGVEMSQVDNYTTETVSSVPVQSQTANTQSFENNDNDTNENDMEMDEKTDNVISKSYGEWGNDKIYFNGKYTSLNDALSYYETTNDNESYNSIVNSISILRQAHFITTEIYNDVMNVINSIQAPQMSQVDNYTTETVSSVPVQYQTTNKSIKGWQSVVMYSVITQKAMTMHDALEVYKKTDAKDIHSVIAYMQDMCKSVRSELEKGLINEVQFNDFKKVFQVLSKGKYNYWRKVFETRKPKDTMTSEIKMWEILGKPKVVKKDDEIINNVKIDYITTQTITLPSEKDFISMPLSEIESTLIKFATEHPNVGDDVKSKINNLCLAYTVEPQYVKIA